MAVGVAVAVAVAVVAVAVVAAAVTSVAVAVAAASVVNKLIFTMRIKGNITDHCSICGREETFDTL